MKIEDYDCIKIKRQGQERIYGETKDMSPEQLLAYYHRIEETLRHRQKELRSKGAHEKS